MLSKKGKKQDEIVAAICGVKEAKKLSQGLHGAAEALKPKSLEELHRLIASETQQDLVPFENTQWTLEWVCSSLASAPKSRQQLTLDPNACVTAS